MGQFITHKGMIPQVTQSCQEPILEGVKMKGGEGNITYSANIGYKLYILSRGRCVKHIRYTIPKLIVSS
jgi:hypothetical protein